MVNRRDFLRAASKLRLPPARVTQRRWINFAGPVEAARNPGQHKVRTLLNQHADVNVRSDDGAATLLWAAKIGVPTEKIGDSTGHFKSLSELSSAAA
jgi:hypothetical protein